MIIHGGANGDLNLYGTESSERLVPEHVAFAHIDDMFRQMDRNQDGYIEEDEVNLHLASDGYIPYWASRAKFRDELGEFLLVQESEEAFL